MTIPVELELQIPVRDDSSVIAFTTERMLSRLGADTLAWVRRRICCRLTREELDLLQSDEGKAKLIRDLRALDGVTVFEIQILSVGVYKSES